MLIEPEGFADIPKGAAESREKGSFSVSQKTRFRRDRHLHAGMYANVSVFVELHLEIFF